MKRGPISRAELIALLREGRAPPQVEDHEATPTSEEPAAAPSADQRNGRASGHNQDVEADSGGFQTGAAGAAVQGRPQRDNRRSRATANRVPGGEDINSDFDDPANVTPVAAPQQPKGRRIRGKQPPRQPADEGRLAGPARASDDSMGVSPSPTVLLSVPAVGGRGTAIGASDDAKQAVAPLHDHACAADASACQQSLDAQPRLHRRLRRSGAAAAPLLLGGRLRGARLAAHPRNALDNSALYSFRC